MLLAVAIAVKLDSPGPIFYSSERIGKKGRVFRCIKFRTMVRDADKRRADVMHMNERDGVLFKISNDPRITTVGRFLRKYSLDELPQFFNVLKGDMSIVGPRPPLASEVQEYKLSHLRRLDVMPGITGLWQVQARQDPSFDSYISLDVAYIDNWSIWLDLKIIVRTIWSSSPAPARISSLIQDSSAVQWLVLARAGVDAGSGARRAALLEAHRSSRSFQPQRFRPRIKL